MLGSLFLIVIVVLSVTMVVAVTTIATLVTSALFRPGLLLRAFGIELVTSDGAVASRWCVLARQCAVYIPALLSVYVGFDVFLSRTQLNFASLFVKAPVLVVLIALLLIWTVWVWQAMRTAAQSIADRMAGTLLVPDGSGAISDWQR